MNVFRWIICIPAILIIYYVIGSFGESIFQSLMNGIQSKNDLSMGATIYKCALCFFCSFVGITAGCLIAPKYKDRISIILILINCFIVSLLFLNFKFNDPIVWTYAAPILFTVLGSYFSLLVIKSYTKQSLFKFTKLSACFLLFGTFSLAGTVFSLLFIISDNSISTTIGLGLGLLSLIIYLMIGRKTIDHSTVLPK